MSAAESLGEMLADGRATAVTLPVGAYLPTKQREAWLAVETFLRANPGASVKTACEATGASANNYYVAKRKLEPGPGEAFSFTKGDAIRADEPIVRKMRRASQDDEDARLERQNARAAPAEVTARRRRVEEAFQRQIAAAPDEVEDEETQVTDTPPESVEDETEADDAPAEITDRDALLQVLEALDGFDTKTQRRIMRAAEAMLDLTEAREP